jgi:hypothetical protein
MQEIIMKILEAIVFLIFAGLMLIYSIVRPWAPFWVDASVIVIVILVALYSLISKEK